MGKCPEPSPGSAVLSASGEEGVEGKGRRLAGAAEPATFRSGAGRGQLATSSSYSWHHTSDLPLVRNMSHYRTSVGFELV